MSVDQAHMLPQASAQERRVSPRRACRLRVDLRLPDGQALQAASIDISCEGIGLLLPGPLPVGTECAIAFSVYTGGAVQRIQASARALNSVFLRHDVRVGFAFSRIAPEQLRLLAGFVS